MYLLARYLFFLFEDVPQGVGDDLAGARSWLKPLLSAAFDDLQDKLLLWRQVNRDGLSVFGQSLRPRHRLGHGSGLEKT